MIFAFICLTVAIANRETAAHGGHNLHSFYWLALWCAAFAFGLLFRSIFIAWLYSAGMLLVGLWLIIGSLLKVSFPGMLINIAMGVVFCLPAVSIVRHCQRSI